MENRMRACSAEETPEVEKPSGNPALEINHLANEQLQEEGSKGHKAVRDIVSSSS